MIGLTPDDHADGHEAIVLAAFRRERDGAGDFERAGNGQHVGLVSGVFQRGTRAFDQLIVQLGVETRFDDQETGHQITPE